jgi:hypothetical protein
LKFDFQTALSLDLIVLREKYAAGFVIANVGTRFRQPLETKCPLCLILSRSRITYTDDNKEETYDELRAFSFWRNFHQIEMHLNITRRPVGKDSLILAIVPSTHKEFDLSIFYNAEQNGYTFLQSTTKPLSDMFATQIVPRQFDLARVTRWFEYCKRHHIGLCSELGSQAQSLKLIDCYSRTVKTAPAEAAYIALSYVWGPSVKIADLQDDPQCCDEPRLPSTLPTVIIDAISVTKSLGVQYLWVDKFCIDQNNPDIKSLRIRQMNSVFENAELTLVAAAGEDANYGLPGVGMTQRKSQPAAKLGNVRIVSTMPSPRNVIRYSKWSTRGWTFQEGALSRRRLVFTDHQMYFECNGMHCYESITWSLDKVHEKDKSRLKEYMPAGVFRQINPEGHGITTTRASNFQTAAQTPFERYLRAVEEYSSRDLSFPIDSFDAFAGVVRMFENSQTPVLQVWGIPYSNDHRGPGHDFCFGLGWNHTSSCWDKDSPPGRRTAFPSWPWVGWAGQVQYTNRKTHYTYAHFDVSSDFAADLDAVSLEFEPDQKVELACYGSSLSDETVQTLRSKPPRILHIKAMVIPPSAYSYSDFSEEWRLFGSSAELFLSRGPATPFELLYELRKADRWHIVVIGSLHNTTLAVVLETIEKTSCRAGLFVVGGLPRYAFRDCGKRTFRIE